MKPLFIDVCIALPWFHSTGRTFLFQYIGLSTLACHRCLTVLYPLRRLGRELIRDKWEKISLREREVESGLPVLSFVACERKEMVDVYIVLDEVLFGALGITTLPIGEVSRRHRYTAHFLLLERDNP